MFRYIVARICAAKLLGLTVAASAQMVNCDMILDVACTVSTLVGELTTVVPFNAQTPKLAL